MFTAVQYLPAKSHSQTAWKNGQGSTAQIAIFPPGSLFPADFTWRLSSATVTADSEFSRFDGCDRFLTIVDGEGMEIQLGDPTESLQLHTAGVIHFSGERPASCALRESGSLIDLGLIYRRAAVQATFIVTKLKEPDVREVSAAKHHFLCLVGLQRDTLVSVRDSTWTLSVLDALIVPRTQSVVCMKNSSLVADDDEAIVAVITIDLVVP